MKVEDVPSESRELGWQRLLRRALVAVIPLANPDFEDLYPSVRTWLLELDSNHVPAREVGLDASGTPVVVGPFGANSGVWTDSAESVADIEVTDISVEQFERAWSIVTSHAMHDSLG